MKWRVKTTTIQQTRTDGSTHAMTSHRTGLCLSEYFFTLTTVILHAGMFQDSLYYILLCKFQKTCHAAGYCESAQQWWCHLVPCHTTTTQTKRNVFIPYPQAWLRLNAHNRLHYFIQNRMPHIFTCFCICRYLWRREKTRQHAAVSLWMLASHGKHGGGHITT